jgi:hypothetical protein
MHRAVALLPSLLPPDDDPSEREAILAARRADAPPLPPDARPTLGERLAAAVARARGGATRPATSIPPAAAPDRQGRPGPA